MNFKNTVVSNFQGAFRGLRNPLESWSRSDSAFGLDTIEYCDIYEEISNNYCIENNINLEHENYYDEKKKYTSWLKKNGILRLSHGCVEYTFIGPKDLNLAHRMIKAGTSDSKFLRQIFVSVDITAPLYWWKEFDTYKVGTVANSTSTMHKLASTPITSDCFEIDDFWRAVPNNQFIEAQINFLEELRQKYLETKDKRYWKELIRWLPEGWLQTRTWTANYAVLRNIVSQRKNHRLKYEWDSFIAWCQTLPYADDLIFYNNGYDNGYILHNLLSQK